MTAEKEEFSTLTTEEKNDNTTSTLDEKDTLSENEADNSTNEDKDEEIKVDLDKVALALSLGDSNFDSGSEMCTNRDCRFMGTLIKKKRNSNVLTIILFLLQGVPLFIGFILQPKSSIALKLLIAFPIFGLLPVMAYHFFHRGYNSYCPKCGTKVNKD